MAIKKAPPEKSEKWSIRTLSRSAAKSTSGIYELGTEIVTKAYQL